MNRELSENLYGFSNSGFRELSESRVNWEPTVVQIQLEHIGLKRVGGWSTLCYLHGTSLSLFQ